MQSIPEVVFTSIEGSFFDLNPMALHPKGKFLCQVM